MGVDKYLCAQSAQPTSLTISVMQWLALHHAHTVVCSIPYKVINGCVQCSCILVAWHAHYPHQSIQVTNMQVSVWCHPLRLLRDSL